jgi:choline dehydrogenase-like flavoprotein
MSQEPLSQDPYDVVIVGAGIAGTLVAKALGQQGKRVLILEAGPQTPPTNRERYLEYFYLASAKTPEAPYPPLTGADPASQATPRATVADTFPSNIVPDWPEKVKQPDGYIYDPRQSYLLQKGPHPFASTYERVAGGTTWHWLGTSLRFLENDFKMKTVYGVERDWPFGVDELLPWYNEAEHQIGVAADAAVQEEELGPIGLRYAPPDYRYPMQGIPKSLVDDAVAAAVDGTSGFVGFEGMETVVTPTPQGRNSQPQGSRRTCAGNTNCIPICPIQAKYDATVTLSEAMNTGRVDLISQAVATRVVVGENGRVTGIEYQRWEQDGDGPIRTTKATATGTVFVLAAHAIETPKLLLMSRRGDQAGLADGVANGSCMVGRNLMDHPLYLSWSLLEAKAYGYRGPLSTSGIESLRDGPFRSQRAAWRVEIGNEGWNFSAGDPWTTVGDFVTGGNASQLNPSERVLFGDALVATLNDVFPRQWRMGFLVEQTADPANRVTLSESLTDGLGLPRPEIHYDLSDYTKLGFVYAEIFARQVYQRMGVRNYTENPRRVTGPDGPVQNPTWFGLQPEWRLIFEALPPELKDPRVTNLPASAGGVPEGFQYFGSGHVVGTTVMGGAASDSVLDPDQRSWDHPNLFMLGSGNFPTVTTANPTLTLAALALKAVGPILAALG